MTCPDCGGPNDHPPGSSMCKRIKITRESLAMVDATDDGQTQRWESIALLEARLLMAEEEKKIWVTAIDQANAIISLDHEIILRLQAKIDELEGRIANALL